MLFVSRAFEGDEYGVVDTDDGVEERVTFDTFSELLNLGIKVSGVTEEQVPGYNRPLICAKPVQNPATATVLQTKTKAVLGVDIVIYDGVIVSIYWGGPGYKVNTRVRLSQFSKQCGFDVFAHLRGKPQRIIFVLDDNITLDVNCLSVYVGDGFLEDCVSFDMHEVTRQDTLDMLYSAFESYAMTCPLDTFIIDRPDRLKAMRRKLIMKKLDK